MPRLILAALAIVATLALAGCESKEEKAERYYQSALQLMEEGDVDRALVELRNVFRYDGFHKEARQLYADTVLARGDMREAYGQYLRLIEQYPDTLPVRLRLAQLAMETGDWDEVERHGRAAIDLAPNDPAVRALAAALDYRDAILADDAGAEAQAADAARAVLEDQPEDRVALRVVIDALSNGPEAAEALPLIDRLLAQDPTTLDLQVAKSRILAAGGDDDATEAQLERMFDLFPDNQEVQGTLVSWYVSRGDVDGAEAVLRRLAEASPSDTAGWITLVLFLQQARGPEAARTELDRLVAEAEAGEEAGPEAADLYRALRAGLDFDAGQRDEAIVALQEIVAEAEPSDQTRRIRASLARMLDSTGNPVGAREQVEAVLSEDPSNVEVLGLRAGWAIADDRPGDAIVDLRAALGQDPRNASLLTLMAQAYERDGNLTLAGDQLAAAVEASGSAPEESLRYAAFLASQSRAAAARAVLADARRATPGDLSVLEAAARLALDQGDLATVDEVLRTLGALGTPDATAMAEALQTAALMAQDRVDETIARLEAEVAEGGEGTERATILLILAKLRGDDPEGARAVLGEALAGAPDSVPLRLLSAELHAGAGADPAAEQELRAVLASVPGQEEAVSRLRDLLFRQDRAEEAAALVDEALVANPSSRFLLTAQATDLEAAGRIDEAVAIYEDLYAQDSGDLAIANNLASLLGTYSEDPADLERAATVARRLRDRPVPAFQDTFGWIAYRQGDLEAAVASLEPAAVGLPDDPLVQFHLGMAYAGVGRTDDARRQLEHALEVAGASLLPQFDEARATLAALPPAAEAAPPGEDPAAGTTPTPGLEAMPDLVPDPASGPASGASTEEGSP